MFLKRQGGHPWLTAFDGKGQPGQSNAVSHGCPPCRFKNINVLNTGRTL